MTRGIGQDLRERFAQAQKDRTCVYANSASDARRLRRALLRGEVLSPASRIYVLPEHWESLSSIERELQKLRALSQLHPTWVFASFSAAILYGFSISYKRLGLVHVRCTRLSHTASGSSIQRHIVTNDQIAEIDGIRVTSIARTLFDTVNSCRFPEGLALADSALRVSGMNNTELVELVKQIRGHYPNSWRAAETASLANGLAENGGESIARAAMIANGYMPPELQVGIPNPLDPADKYRVDFYWRLPNGNVIGELDGHEKYKNPTMTKGRDIVEVLADERLRESSLTSSGAKVMRFSYKDAVNTPKLCRLLTAYGIPNGYEIPRVARY